MHEDAVDSVEKQRGYCEALSMTREAERLQEMTLIFYGIGSCDAEPGNEPPVLDGTSIGEEEEVTVDDVAALRVQSAARAVGDEAARLQGETERYATELLAAAPGVKGGEPTSERSRGRATEDGYGVVIEAMAVVSEAQRLQSLVERLLARIAGTAGTERIDDD